MAVARAFAALVLFCIGLIAAFLTVGLIYLTGATRGLNIDGQHDLVFQPWFYGVLALASFGGALWFVFSMRRKLSHPRRD